MSNRTDIKIFIASSGELNDERKESIIVITELNKRYRHLHLEPVLFEIDTPSGNFPWKERIQDGINPLLDEAHIVVALFYSKAGTFTVEEFNRAMEQQKKVYLYLKDGFIARSVDEGKKYLEVLQLKADLEKQSALRYQPYKTLHDYYGMLYRDLEKYIDDHYPVSSNDNVGQSPSPTIISTSRQHIPLAPRPYLAHPYPIVKNFTGRKEEMTRLTEWYKYEKETPMCVVEAIGGMGKSALCWKWLQDEVIAAGTKVDGIIWWSFYDQGFEDFIHHVYEYCIPEHVRNRQQRVDKATEAINVLASGHFLLVLDGFERVLRGYAQMMAMYIQEKGLSRQGLENMKAAFDIQQRTPITPRAEKLLRVLCSGNSKTLMTTRLYPATIEGLAGVKRLQLTGLSKTDTIAFFIIEGITGTDDEMIRAGEVYGFHPLMLKLLSTAIKRSLSRNINKALQEAFSKGLIDDKEPQKILSASYQLLNPDEQTVVSIVSVFSTAFTFDAAKALFPSVETEKLETTLVELCNLGFLLYSEQQQLFDFHPILRSYLYDRLTGKDVIHELAITYFTALPVREKIITLKDLEPVIEQYHHLVRARKYDEACGLYSSRLGKLLLHQFAQYTLSIMLCRQLFLVPTDSSSRLQPMTQGNQSYILNRIGLCYAYTGQLNESSTVLVMKLYINYNANDRKNLGIGLKNMSDQVQIRLGKSSVAQVHLVKAIRLLKGLRAFSEAGGYRVLGNVFTARSGTATSDEGVTANEYLQKALRFGLEQEEYGLLSSVAQGFTRKTIASIKDNNRIELLQEALDWGIKAMEYADQCRINSIPVLFYFLQAYEALARVLMTIRLHEYSLVEWRGRIMFYDEYFQEVVEIEALHPKNCTTLAERCIHEGLMLSRKINRVYDECTLSLLLAQMEWQKLAGQNNKPGNLVQVEKLVIEVHALGFRLGFRTFLADLHLFCAEVLLDRKDMNPGHNEKLMNMHVRDHIAKVREYALDNSTFQDIFQPPNADSFYEDIPEYAMLKRGLTEDERIKYGYYAAWVRAARLEQLL